MPIDERSAVKRGKRMAAPKLKRQCVKNAVIWQSHSSLLANLQAAPVAKTGYTAPNCHKKEKPAILVVPGHKTCYTTLDHRKIEKRVYTLEEAVGVPSA